MFVNYYPSYGDVCFIYTHRLLLMPPIWRDPRWISRGFLLLTLKLTLREFLRRRNCLMLWRKLVGTISCGKLWFSFLYSMISLFYTCFSVLADVKNKWENSSWGRKLIVQKRRANLTDFDRFKLMLAKIKVGYNICLYFSKKWVLNYKCVSLAHKYFALSLYRYFLFWLITITCFAIHFSFEALAFFELSILMDRLNIFLQKAGLVRQELAKLKKESAS